MDNFIATWIDIVKEEQLEKLREQSYTKPVVLFKYSLTCGVSYAACDRLADEWKAEDEDVYLYRINVKEQRPLSMQIASDYGVIHQSPQVLIIKDGKSVRDISHHRINFGEIVPFIDPRFQTI